MKLVTWSLATFHATAFVLAIVLFVYSRDALGAGLSGLNTFVGLGLFVALWGTTYVTTSRAKVLTCSPPSVTGPCTRGAPRGVAPRTAWRSWASSALSPSSPQF